LPQPAEQPALMRPVLSPVARRLPQLRLPEPGWFRSHRSRDHSEEYRDRLGAVTLAKTVPALKAFVEAGGNLVAVGTSSWIGKALGLPLKDHLVEKDADGKEKHLSPAKFYVPVRC